MVACICDNVNTEKLNQVIQEFKPKNLEELQKVFPISTKCKCCEKFILDCLSDPAFS